MTRAPRSTSRRRGPAVIVGYVLEEATGRPLDELVAEYVTEPLGLRSVAFTTLEPTLTELGRVVNPDGTSYDIDPPRPTSTPRPT